MKFLLDTNVIIAALTGGGLRLRDRMAGCDEGDLVTSAIAYGEVLHGSVRGKPPPRALLDAFLEDIPVLPFDRAAGAAYAAIPLRRASYDRLIAAHALSLGLTVVTANAADFDDVPGLRVENWTLPPV